MPALHDIPRIRPYIPGCASHITTHKRDSQPALGLALSPVLLQGSRSMTEYFFCPAVHRGMLDRHRHHDLKVCRVVGSEPWSRVLGSMQRRFAACWNPVLAISDDQLGDRSKR
jgi:hypothetical protein